VHFILSASLSLTLQSTICIHMMLTIHTFMAIITADNYMDETFFHCNRISVRSFFFAQTFFFPPLYVNTHFGIEERKKKTQRQRTRQRREEKSQIQRNWRQRSRSLFMISRGWTFALHSKLWRAFIIFRMESRVQEGIIGY
jgi:hypothetical protein